MHDFAVDALFGPCPRAVVDDADAGAGVSGSVLLAKERTADATLPPPLPLPPPRIACFGRSKGAS